MAWFGVWNVNARPIIFCCTFFHVQRNNFLVYKVFWGWEEGQNASQDVLWFYANLMFSFLLSWRPSEIGSKKRKIWPPVVMEMMGKMAPYGMKETIYQAPTNKILWSTSCNSWLSAWVTGKRKQWLRGQDSVGNFRRAGSRYKTDGDSTTPT